MSSLLPEAPDPAPGRDGIGFQGHREEVVASSTKVPFRAMDAPPFCPGMKRIPTVQGKGFKGKSLQVMGCAAEKVEAAFLSEKMKQGLSASLAKGIAVRKASVPIVGEEEGPGRSEQG